MIEFAGVSKQFGTQVVLNRVNLKINPGERIGIVGPNGAGKSTVFQLVTGALEPDKGDVLLPKKTRVGHLRQQLNAHAVDDSLLQYAKKSIDRLETVRAEITELDTQLDGPNRDDVLRKLADLEAEFTALGGYEMKQRAEAALCGLGFRPGDLARPFRDFSGGWQMRAELVRTLIGQPHILLLDEPSNYLDLPAVEWLTRYLRGFPGTLLLISHDRFLLEQLVSCIVEVNAGEINRYQGDFAYYQRERNARLEQRLAQKKNQDRKRAEIERFIERFRAKNTKAPQVQSRIRMLEKMEEIVIPTALTHRSWLRIAAPPHCGVEAVRLEQAGLAYMENEWVLRGVDLQIERGDKVAIVGFNGMGKTTLLRMLAGTLPPTEGKRVLGHQVVLGYQSQEFAETMLPRDTVLDTLRKRAPDSVTRGDLRKLLGGFGFSGDDVDKQVQVLSGGEKIRLAFARLFVDPPNLLVLDEPTTHLDIDGRSALEEALVDYKGTIVFVSHDVTFVRRVAQQIIAIGMDGVKRFHGDYDYYREKTGGEALTATPEPVTDAADKKAEKKSREAARKEAIRRERKMKKQLTESEEAIERLEAEQAGIAEAMNGPEADYAALNRRLEELRQELETRNQAWLEAAEFLEG